MNIEDALVKIIRLGLEGDKENLAKYANLLMRKSRSKNEKLFNELQKILSFYSVGNPTYRAMGLDQIPVDNETRSSLLKFEEPLFDMEPRFSEKEAEMIDQFLREREKTELLVSNGLQPANSILFHGKPGTGKTYTAKWIAYKLNLPLLTIDLASSISSYLGRTGRNIKAIIDYAKRTEAVLLLDEFDAIAKKRDDMSDLGELKRIVNVLLKELEDWPINSVVIAATNHPQILDEAIWRRFDYTLEFEMPDDLMRKELFSDELTFGMTDDNVGDISVIASIITRGMSCADTVQYAKQIQRQALLNDYEIIDMLLSEIRTKINGFDREEKANSVIAIRRNFPEYSIRKLAAILGISQSSIQRYLKEGQK